MKNFIKKCAIALCSCIFISSIGNTSVSFTIVEGNDSVSLLTTGILDTGPDMGMFATIQTSNFGTDITTTASGSLLSATPVGFGLIGKTDDAMFPFDVTAGGNGTNSLTFDATGFDIFAIVIKAGNGFILADFTSMSPFTGSGTVCTDGSCSIGGSTIPAIFVGGNPMTYSPPFTGQNNPGISHVSLYGASTVPEPATWLMMIVGFGLVGLALRRRYKLA